VVSDATFIRAHPMGTNPEVVYHYRRGERAFIESYRQTSQRWLREHPGDFLSRLVERGVNAFVLLQSSRELEPSAFLLEATTQAHLSKRQLVLGTSGGVVWACLDLEPDELRERLQGLQARQEKRLFDDWRRARSALAARRRQPETIAWGLAHALLPTLAIFVGALRATVRSQPGFRFAAGLYLLYLAPYVVVSHYVRYQLGLLALAAYLVWLAQLPADSLSAGRSQTRSKATDNARWSSSPGHSPEGRPITL
jgi:hypothetical protein